jgi:hypothetical protein
MALVARLCVAASLAFLASTPILVAIVRPAIEATAQENTYVRLAASVAEYGSISSQLERVRVQLNQERPGSDRAQQLRELYASLERLSDASLEKQRLIAAAGSNGASPSLADELHALRSLEDSNGDLRNADWAVRGFLICALSLPALLAFLVHGGMDVYHRISLLRHRLAIKSIQDVFEDEFGEIPEGRDSSYGLSKSFNPHSQATSGEIVLPKIHSEDSVRE